jgi:hypothetical protein
MWEAILGEACPEDRNSVLSENLHLPRKLYVVTSQKITTFT